MGSDAVGQSILSISAVSVLFDLLDFRLTVQLSAPPCADASAARTFPCTSLAFPACDRACESVRESGVKWE